jgi:hypothetical protein
MRLGAIHEAYALSENESVCAFISDVNGPINTRFKSQKLPHESCASAYIRAPERETIRACRRLAVHYR